MCRSWMWLAGSGCPGKTEFHVYEQVGELMTTIARSSGKEVTRTKGCGVRDHPRL